MRRVRRWLRRAALAGSVASAGVLVASALAAPASADAPSRTAWWGAPDPNTPAGGLHVAVAPQQLLAYGAVAVSMSSDGTGTLEVKLAGSEGSGTLQACPTKDDSWQSGDAQPMSSAPGFDCSVHAYQGMASSDGKTLTFLVDGSAETTPGTLSLAIVPVQTTAAPAVGTDTGTDTTQPYNVEIDKPDASSFTQTSGSSSTSSGSLMPPPPPPAATGQSATSAGGAPASGPVNIPPAGPATVPTGSNAGTAPMVAGQGGTTPTTGVAAMAARRPADNNRSRNAALALLVLLFVAMMLSGSEAAQRMPRRLGGAGAHRGAPMPANATPAQAQAMVMAQLFAPRGLGRFAKPRLGSPRPLT